MCELIGMRKGVEVRLGPGDRERLDAVIGSGNSPQKHVWRARIVLLSADGLGTMAIQRQTGKGKPTIWRWQARFMTAGVDGLLHDATRPGRKKPLPAATVERVVEMTLAGPPGEATHWTGRAMAKAAGISLRSVQRIWAAHGLQPHRVRRFKLSNDAKFAAKVQDLGLPGTTEPSRGIEIKVNLRLMSIHYGHAAPSGLQWSHHQPTFPPPASGWTLTKDSHRCANVRT